jgi:hypothetical protein
MQITVRGTKRTPEKDWVPIQFTVEADVKDGLAVHQWSGRGPCTEGYWVVTHVSTGYRAHTDACFDTQEEAIACREALLPLCNWEQECPVVSEDAVRAIVDPVAA